MGILGMIGKMAGSKMVETVETELAKKQNREQTSSYCNYVKANITRICKMLAGLENETKTLIDEIALLKNVKLSYKEKANLRISKEKTIKNLQYLYLARDFFTVLSKNASGLILKNEELMLVTKFAPFFDGVPVFEIDDDRDDSLLGEIKEMGKELMEAFISSKKNPNHFDFNEYMSRYGKKIAEYIMPDINSAIESFKKTMEKQEVSVASELTVSPVAIASATVTKLVSAEIECPKCHAKIKASSKFCLECGSKIETSKPAFCSECGLPIAPGAKFCSACGFRIV